eukprot:c44924_g1_i1 orf=36-209(-)
MTEPKNSLGSSDDYLDLQEFKTFKNNQEKFDMELHCGVSIDTWSCGNKHLHQDPTDL